MIRIVSYNIHACIGSDGVFDPERIVNVAQSLRPHFLALQEVEDRFHNGAAVSDFLSGQLGMRAYRGVTLRRDDSNYGNLLLARSPALALSRHDISVPGGEPRGAIDALFVLGSTRLRLVATHLGLRAPERKQQIVRLLDYFAVGDADIDILAGDINEWRPPAWAPGALARAFDVCSRARTFPARAPVLALDRIYVRPGNIVSGSHAARSRAGRYASDHLPLVCDLAVDRDR